MRRMSSIQHNIQQQCCMKTGVTLIKSERAIIEFTNSFHSPKTQNTNSQNNIDCTVTCTFPLQSPALSWCAFLWMQRPIWFYSRVCVQYRLFTAFHYHLSVLYISKPCVSVKQSSNSILITNHTHSALYLKGTGGVKTQCFIKTIVMAFCQQWPQPSQPFGLIQCSLSHLEASPWRSYSHFLGHQWVQLKWFNCKNGLCAAICFAINNGWVTTLFKIIKLLNSSEMKTCAYTQKQWN